MGGVLRVPPLTANCVHTDSGLELKERGARLSAAGQLIASSPGPVGRSAFFIFHFLFYLLEASRRGVFDESSATK